MQFSTHRLPHSLTSPLPAIHSPAWACMTPQSTISKKYTTPQCYLSSKWNWQAMSRLCMLKSEKMGLNDEEVSAYCEAMTANSIAECVCTSSNIAFLLAAPRQEQHGCQSPWMRAWRLTWRTTCREETCEISSKGLDMLTNRGKSPTEKLQATFDKLVVDAQAAAAELHAWLVYKLTLGDTLSCQANPTQIVLGNWITLSTDWNKSTVRQPICPSVWYLHIWVGSWTLLTSRAQKASEHMSLCFQCHTGSPTWVGCSDHSHGLKRKIRPSDST